MQENSPLATIKPPSSIQRALLRKSADRKMWFDLEVWSNPGGTMACAKRLNVRIDTDRLGPEIEMRLRAVE